MPFMTVRPSVALSVLIFSRETVPDATTLLNFRHLLETHQLTESIFNTINAHLAEKGLFLREGTLVDAMLIAAASSTKNKEGKRDGEMHQTKKDNQWHFDMKAHTGLHFFQLTS
jgi:transposase, IS5 family